MRAMVINAFGGTEVFEEAELARPEVTVGHVLVRVCASSVNPVDFKIRQLGAALPFAPTLPAVLGMDFAGTIEAVGEGVSDFSPGDEIYGCAGGLGSLKGSLSEFMLADARLIAHKPRTLGMRESAALPLVAITAYEGLQRAGVFTTNENEVKKVLVHGGSGGVGHIAVQLARYFKHEVFATGGGSAQMDLIEGLGATAINYREQSVADYVEAYTGGAGFDAIFDSVGDANLSKSIEAIKLNGDIATTSSMSELDLTLAHLKGASLHVVFMLIPMIHDLRRETHGQILKHVAEIADQGKLKPVLSDRRFSLAEAAAAHELAESGSAMGKIVIDVADQTKP